MKPQVPLAVPMQVAFLKGARFAISPDRCREVRECELAERKGREAGQPCNPEGAQWVVAMRFPDGRCESKSVCSNHAAQLAYTVGLAWPPARERGV